MPYKLVSLLCLLAGLTLSTSAEARHRHHHHRSHVVSQTGESQTCDNNGRCATQMGSQGASPVRYSRLGGRMTHATSEGVIGGRPAGCPHAYCGCGARRYLGISDTRLDLAANWPRYYRGATPVAVWNHHIAIIERMTGPRMAILRDYNSGGGLSRVHERSIAGARIVGGAAYASR